MLKEFREFAMRGNVMDLAIGVIIGAAFSKIITALVDQIITPLLGLIVGGKNLATLNFHVGDAVIAYGAFLQAVLDFILVAFVIFMIVKTLNRMQRPTQEAEVAAMMKDCPYCLSSVPILATRCPACTSELQAA